jgi:carbon storage regulator
MVTGATGANASSGINDRVRNFPTHVLDDSRRDMTVRPDSTADAAIVSLRSFQILIGVTTENLVPPNQRGDAMLVLSRALGEEIVIDGHIRIVVVEVRRKRIRLGICAPQSVIVDRREIHERRSLDWSVESCAARPKSRPEVCGK